MSVLAFGLLTLIVNSVPPVKSVPNLRPPTTSEIAPGMMMISESRKYQYRLPTMSTIATTTCTSGKRANRRFRGFDSVILGRTCIAGEHQQSQESVRNEHCGEHAYHHAQK